MRRYWVDENRIQDGHVVLSGDIFHHIFDVCRQQLGSRFEVLTESGKAHFVEVISVSKKDARAKILEIRELPQQAIPHLHLAICIPKFPVFEAVLEKAVELGVKSIQPLFSDYSFVREASSVSQNKSDRWQKIVRSAMQQSGRGDWLELKSPRFLKDFAPSLNRNAAEKCLIAYEGETPHSIRQEISSWQPRSFDSVTALVGAEGGFSKGEIELFQSLGIQPVTLGAQVLRVETACMAVISVLKYELDLMG